MPLSRPIRIAFRADASTLIGTGHLRRCNSLASALAAFGCDIRFFCRDLGLDTRTLVDGSFAHYPLPAPGVGQFRADASAPAHGAWAGVTMRRDVADLVAVMRATQWSPDWVIIDHYAFSAPWHQAIRSRTGARIAAIDDLADRVLAVDVLVDHSWHADHQAKYDGLVPASATFFYGPHYALLDRAYATAARYKFHSEVRSIGVFMGGVDKDDTSSRVIDAIAASSFAGRIELVTTSANRNLEALKRRANACRQLDLRVNLPHLADFFARHDLHIGAGGGATWERLCIGAPSILLSFAANHDTVLEPLRDLGVAEVLEQNWTNAQLSDAIAKLLADKALRSNYTKRGRALVDGQGCQRVARSIMEL